MIPKDILKKVKQIEIKTSRMVNDVFAGQYHSVFKGQGIEFDEVREYQFGDDIRTIDWNVTARANKPYVKKFIEERELTVMLLVDVSASHQFGSVNMLKNQLAAEIAALLAFCAIRNKDNVGLINFTDRVEKFIPPRKGLSHVLRVAREVLYFKPQGHQTDVLVALRHLSGVMSRKTICFLISDFLDPNIATDDFKRTLSVANRRHDIIPIVLNDPREAQLPDIGLVSLLDGERNLRINVDTSSSKARKAYEKNYHLQQSNREKLFLSLGIDYVNVSTEGSYADSLVRFFKNRRRRIK